MGVVGLNGTNTLKERFEARVDRNGPVVVPAMGQCWLWTGFVEKNGIGRLVDTEGNRISVRKVAYFLQYNSWTEEYLTVLCENERCINPAHMREGHWNEGNTMTLERIVAKCVRTEKNAHLGIGCLEWSGSLTEDGYGKTKVDGKTMPAHRATYQFVHNVTLDRKTLVCHHCDNPPCCEPTHLFTGSCQNNTDDMMQKGRHRVPVGEDAPNATLTESQVIEIRARVAAGERQKDLLSVYGISSSQINRIVKGTRWAHVPLAAKVT